MRARKTVLLLALLCCFGWSSQGCSLLFFERVPEDGPAPCDEPTCGSRGLVVADTVIASQAAAGSLALLIGGLALPMTCGEDGFICVDFSPVFYLGAGLLAVPALVYGISAGFGHAWEKDCETAWDRHRAWAEQRSAPPDQASPPKAPAGPPSPAFAHPIEDVTCPPQTRAMGALPPRAWERFCAAVWPAGLVVRHGPARAWYPDGQVASEGLYLDGERHGRWTFWYPDGQRRLEATYDRGQKVGRWKRWSRDGRTLATE